MAADIDDDVYDDIANYVAAYVDKTWLPTWTMMWLPTSTMAWLLHGRCGWYTEGSAVCPLHDTSMSMQYAQWFCKSRDTRTWNGWPSCLLCELISNFVRLFFLWKELVYQLVLLHELSRSNIKIRLIIIIIYLMSFFIY